MPTDLRPGGAAADPAIDGCVKALCLGAHFPKAYEINIRDIKDRLGIAVHKIHYRNGTIQALPFL